MCADIYIFFYTSINRKDSGSTRDIVTTQVTALKWLCQRERCNIAEGPGNAGKEH